MFKTSAAALLVSTALVTGAMAQTATTEPSTTAPATPGMSSTTTAPAAAMAAGSAQFMSQQDRSQFRASKFVGLAIYGSDNNRVGDINEILIDGTGAAKGIVIGVGGFLGIGEKNVAVPFSAVQWVNERPATAAVTGTAATAPATGMGMGMGTRDATMTGTTAAPAPTTASAPTTPSRSPAEMAAANGYPDHGKITMTKADLQNAPAFRWYSDMNK